MEGSEHIWRTQRSARRTALALLLALTLVLSGCGSEAPQDKNAPSGTWRVTVLDWHFPRIQPLGTPQSFTVRVRNDDTRTIPQLTITISGLQTRVYQPGAAGDVRPVWLTDEVDFGGFSTYNSPLQQTFTVGAVEPGDVATYNVNLTPSRRGAHVVGYRLSPAPLGDNKIVNASDGAEAAETREVVIDPDPVFDRRMFKD